jgi:D-alanyl-lipoteichoic acid acyltransferase DltB (MBOAT superfamily)
VADRSVGGLEVAMAENRPQRRDRALFLTWAIMGLWHGAAWTFVLWGVYHAVLVYAHRLLAARFRWISGRPRALAGFAVTVPLAMLGWIPFRAEGLGAALQLLGKVLQPRAYLSLGMRENTYLVAALVMLMVVAAYFVRETLVPWLETRPVAWALAQTAAYSVAFALVFVFLRPINQFIYFQF